MSWLGALNGLNGLVWMLMLMMTWAGGWLLCAHFLRVRQHDRLLVGLGVGFVLFIVTSNLLAWLVPVSISWWAAALLIFFGGLAAGWRNRRQCWHWRAELQVGPQIASLAMLVLVFTLINRGLAIFDDYHNLPLLSRLAAGDFPPHFYLNPDQRLAYHYGLHLFAASLVRLGGLSPWAAFDLAKALSIALTVMFGWLWFRRTAAERLPEGTIPLAAVLGAGLVLFGGGARWVLAVLPSDWLAQVSSGLHLLGTAAETGSSLATALVNPWKIEGGGPLAFPFAFVNGIFTPLNFALGGPGAAPQLTIILLMLLARQRWRPVQGLVYGLLVASLAITAEHLFVLVWVGLAGIVIIAWLRKKGRSIASWGWVLIPSLLLGLTGGGVITEAIRGLLVATASTSVDQSIGFAGFGLRWPPAVLSAHLGALSLTNPAQALIALAEIGPIILLAPWIIWRTWRQARRLQVVWAGLGLASLLGFVIPVFVRYGVERDISRLMGSGLFIWLILGFPLLSRIWQKRGQWSKLFLSVCYLVIVLGGLALFFIQWVAIARPRATYFVQEIDTGMSQKYWNRLAPGARVFDTLLIRSITLFGRPSGKAYLDIYHSLPEWQDLVNEYNPLKIAQAGYDYIYIDRETWQQLSVEQKQALQMACVHKVGEITAENNDFRWLLQLNQCQGND